MKTLTIVLIAAGVLLLLILSFAPCNCVDHYANQVVHAGVGSIAGPAVEIEERSYSPPTQSDLVNEYIDMDDSDELISGIVGKVN